MNVVKRLIRWIKGTPPSMVEANAARYQWILDNCTEVKLVYVDGRVQHTFGLDEGPSLESTFLSQQIDARRGAA